MDLKKLAEPFGYDGIEWRIGRSGFKNNKVWATAFCYITARAIHDRLDEVCLPENWQLRYHEHLGQTVCEIGVKTEDGWVWKAGGGDQTDFEAFKGGLSSAEKRAGVPWGIGRYLYKLDETSVETSLERANDWNYQGASKDKSGNIKTPVFYWQNPKLPPWALPRGTKDPEPEKKKSEQRPGLEVEEEPLKGNYLQLDAYRAGAANVKTKKELLEYSTEMKATILSMSKEEQAEVTKIYEKRMKELEEKK